MTVEEAYQVLVTAQDGNHKPPAGWDRRVEAAIVTIFGVGNSNVGRRRLMEMAIQEYEGRKGA